MTKEEQLEIIEKIQLNLISLKEKIECTKTARSMNETKLWYAGNIMGLTSELRNEFLRFNQG